MRTSSFCENGRNIITKKLLSVNFPYYELVKAFVVGQSFITIYQVLLLTNDIIRLKFTLIIREAAKKGIFLVARPLRGRGRG